MAPALTNIFSNASTKNDVENKQEHIEHNDQPNIGEQIKSTIGSAYNNVKGAVTGGNKAEQDDKENQDLLGSAAEKTRSAAEDVRESVHKNASEAADTLLDRAEAARDTAEDKADQASDDTARGYVQQVKDFFSGAQESAGEKADAAKESAADSIEQTGSTISSFADAIADKVRAATVGGDEEAERGQEGATEDAATFTEQAKEAVSNAADSVMGTTSEIYHSAKETLLGENKEDESEDKGNDSN